ncbi:GNAT family N-acetyltransferase [Bradyrhizobium sp. LHD-71]|uniref:GNAT family N-acetyltransferase n=1 Tax=Bradyrhizobium sp. LHD-71 TaxID=3072141 RepID=UPI00280E5CFF|nr:GNAT family N-acetyltransferase [Bradyrhizobium sp. LHD-71]MDQ8728948.1 GNAT family N-acetyltransferase [Bradyrhizobium sp. LHD-71]
MRIDISPGGPSWEAAEQLLHVVWPPHVVKTLVWGDVVWGHADRRVLVREGAPSHELVCHVGLFTRSALWNDVQVTIGGIGGVATHPDRRKSGLASAAMCAAMECFASEDKDFAVLFCEPHNYEFYRQLGWRQFEGAVFAEQPQGRVRFDVMAAFVYDLKLAPRGGTIDLRGLPW